MDVRITKLRRDPDGGFWRARVTVDSGVTVDVHRRYGSWLQEVRSGPWSREFKTKEVPREVAAKLQEKVRPIEKRERERAPEAVMA